MKIMNETINVNSFYFPGGSVERALPKTIEHGFDRIAFTDGLQYLVQKGSRFIRLFDMDDGRNTYRLKHEEDQWTLISVKPQRRAMGY